MSYPKCSTIVRTESCIPSHPTRVKQILFSMDTESCSQGGMWVWGTYLEGRSTLPIHSVEVAPGCLQAPGTNCSIKNQFSGTALTVTGFRQYLDPHHLNQSNIFSPLNSEQRFSEPLKSEQSVSESLHSEQLGWQVRGWPDFTQLPVRITCSVTRPGIKSKSASGRSTDQQKCKDCYCISWVTAISYRRTSLLFRMLAYTPY